MAIEIEASWIKTKTKVRTPVEPGKTFVVSDTRETESGDLLVSNISTVTIQDDKTVKVTPLRNGRNGLCNSSSLIFHEEEINFAGLTFYPHLGYSDCRQTIVYEERKQPKRYIFNISTA